MCGAQLGLGCGEDRNPPQAEKQADVSLSLFPCSPSLALGETGRKERGDVPKGQKAPVTLPSRVPTAF